MADESQDTISVFEFHPGNIPSGMTDFHLDDDLAASQQHRLNELKRNRVREDEAYLADHPEVRALIALILRKVMRRRPEVNIHSCISEFFTKPYADVRDEVDAYLEQRNLIISANSTLNLDETWQRELERSTKASMSVKEDYAIKGGVKQQMGTSGKEIAVSLLEEILDNVMSKVGSQELFTDDYEKHLSSFAICQEILDDILNDDQFEEADIMNESFRLMTHISVDYENESFLSIPSSVDNDEPLPSTRLL